ncbi:MAG: TIGR02680 family protein, partial [Myxococcaceae bacterium]
MSSFSKLPVAQAARWQLLRAGIQNVWEYDDQRFVFTGGRLLLKGQNASGKTKALEVLLPFLLDASLQPTRLDPFGTNARAMRWNLINESNPDTTISIGYVWVELGRVHDGQPQYCTLGAGLKARRTATSVEDWYFLTPQRIDQELSLFDANRIPLTKPQLATALGDRGQLFDRGADYRRSLNEHLFGLSADQYSALVDALLQLRRPQLSKQLDPQELSNILTTSLPPLDAGVVGALAEGFERLDRHRAEREEFHGSLQGLRRFLGIYRGYVASFVKARTQELTKAESAYHAARAERRSAQEQKEAADSRLAQLLAAIEQLENEGLALEERIRTLRASEAFRGLDALSDAEAAARRAESTASRARAALKTSQQSATRARDAVQRAEAESAEEKTTLERAKTSSLSAAQSAALEPSHSAGLAALETGDLAGAGAVFTSSLRIRTEAIAALRALQKKVTEATQAVEKAWERVTFADETVSDAQNRLQQAETVEQRARQRLLEDVGRWSEGCRRLKVDLEALLELLPEEMRPSLAPLIQLARDTLEEVLRSAKAAHALTLEQQRALRSEREQVASSQHRPPAASAWRSPRSLDRLGAPLYLLCDFKPEVSAADRAGLEAALEASGLLDAWVMPDGQVLDAKTFEAWLSPAPVTGPTVADVLSPALGAPVSEEVIHRVLGSLGLTSPGTESTGSHWVSVDGRFALGPLRGQSGKAQAAFVGAAAREQARLRRLAELDAQLLVLAETLETQARTLAEARAERAALEAEIDAFPSVTPLQNAQAAAKDRAEELTAAKARRDELFAAFQKCELRRTEAAAALDGKAAETNLRGWVDRLDDLRERTADYGRTTERLQDIARRWQRSVEHEAKARWELAEQDRELTEVRESTQLAEGEALRAQAHAQTLRDAMGSTREELLGSLQSWEARQRNVQREVKFSRMEEAEARQSVGAFGAQTASMEEQVQRCELLRKEVEVRVRETVRKGLYSLAGVDLGDGVLPESGVPRIEHWSYTDLLVAMRRADEALAKVDPSDAARDKAWNKVNEVHQELARSLRPEVRVVASQLEGITLYEATFNSRPLSLLELATELETDVTTRDRLLGDEERKLFETFLSGETHEHIRERLREASALVKRMNVQLHAHP